MRLGLDSLLIRNSDIFYVSLGDGTYVLLGSDGVNYFALGETGSFIWDKLASKLSLRSLCDALVREFDVDEDTCVTETAAFIESLLSQGFARTVPDQASE
jgi:hypothetical protein